MTNTPNTWNFLRLNTNLFLKNVHELTAKSCSLLYQFSSIANIMNELYDIKTTSDDLS